MSVRPVRMAPSILAADFARLADAITLVERAGADEIHVDVMDGHFVPNITIGPPVVKALRKVTRLPLDVHLMITAPERYLEAFVEAGATTVTVHAEATPHLHRAVTRVRELGAKAGVAINPATPVSVLDDVLGELDLVLVMSVNPGFGGQKFIRRCLDKIVAVRRALDAAGHDAVIEVDGGVEQGNARALADAGATLLVAGVAIFGAPDPAAALGAIRTAANVR